MGFSDEGKSANMTLKIVHVNNNEVTGGAARAVQRLHNGLLKREIDSTLFARNTKSNQDAVVRFEPEQSLFDRFRRTLRYAWMRSDFFPRYVSWPIGGMPLSDDRSRFVREVAGQLPRVDLLHFHWIAEFIDIPAFLEEVDIPIVWTLHDMNPLTGGCHYTSGCRRFEQSCGCCPRLNSNRENDPSHRSWKRKHTAYQKKIRRDHFHVVAPSEWLVQEAKRSSLLTDASIHCIPHGLDHTLFRPRDFRQEQRRVGISSCQKIVLFVAHSSKDPRKGFNLLSEAVKDGDFKDVTLVSIGRKEPTVAGDFRHVHVGRVDDDRRLSVLYSMADVFVIPSLQEAFGQTPLEAMACGTPVVGFKTGGIPDMVKPGETGWLAETGDVRSLRNALETALESDAERKRMGRRCREIVEEEYTLDRQAQQYEELYNSILEPESVS